MDTSFILPPSLYDVLLDSIQFNSAEQVRESAIYHLNCPPKHAKKAKRALSHLLPTIVRLRQRGLLKMLSETLLEYGVPVEGTAVKEAAALPLDQAIDYLNALFALGWGINQPLSNTEPPVLSIALHDVSLTHWLLRQGADPNIGCDTDYTPLSIAVRSAAIPTVQLLLQHAQHGHNGHLVFHATQRLDLNESSELIRLLHYYKKPIDDILYQDPKSYRLRAPFLRGTPLYYACEQDKLPVALTLLDLGADPDKACVRYNEAVGPSPRDIATHHGWTLVGTADIVTSGD